jgi:predicted ATP-dependent endonuclease of OLD family
MIHRLRISNFQSIREEVQLDFRIPRTCPDLPRFRQAHSRNGVRLPSVIAFIGPNGSGKTTLLRAITETIEFAHRSFDLGPSQNIPYFLPFLSSESQAAPTRIEVDFDAVWFSSDPGEPSLCRYTLELQRHGSDLTL